ncbi:MAG: anti-sigma F factor [Erysipelotrichaceae bacterium]|nr:anti-sigma F factor [Erysipelotrichaceae bacterium]
MNKIELKFNATLENEAVARNAIGLFAATINCTIEDIIDVKTIVSEAVSNAIIHGYEQDKDKEVIVSAIIEDNIMHIIVTDEGVGIENVIDALRVNYSSKNRSGLGFTIIKSLSDDLQIRSKKDMGTKLIVKKVLTIKGL